MKNRITTLFEKKQKNILSIYYTAGFPQLENTLEIAEALQSAGVDMLEIGMPFSDPLADGPIIQKSSQRALKNGMTLALLFRQLESLREKITIPVLLMGYLNPVLQMGMETFLSNCRTVEIDGIILPDLPVVEYNKEYKKLFKSYALHHIFLITPETSDKRLKFIDQSSSGFLYVVSTASTTGAKNKQWQEQKSYFQKIKNTTLKNPTLLGFNIKDKKSFAIANQYTCGGIIGSAFIEELNAKQKQNFTQVISSFLHKIR